MQSASDDLRVKPEDVKDLAHNKYFYVFGCERNNSQLVRILDKKGFIKVQRGNAEAEVVKASNYQDTIKRMWEELAVYKTDIILRPDYYLCIGAKVMDFSSPSYEQLIMLMDMEVMDMDPDEEIIVVGAGNQA